MTKTQRWIVGYFYIGGLIWLVVGGGFARSVYEYAPVVRHPERFAHVPELSRLLIANPPFTQACMYTAALLGSLALLLVLKMVRDSGQRFVWSCFVGMLMVAAAATAFMFTSLGLLLLPEMANATT